MVGFRSPVKKGTFHWCLEIQSKAHIQSIPEDKSCIVYVMQSKKIQPEYSKYQPRTPNIKQKTHNKKSGKISE